MIRRIIRISLFNYLKNVQIFGKVFRKKHIFPLHVTCMMIEISHSIKIRPIRIHYYLVEVKWNVNV